MCALKKKQVFLGYSDHKVRKNKRKDKKHSRIKKHTITGVLKADCSIVIFHTLFDFSSQHTRNKKNHILF